MSHKREIINNFTLIKSSDQKILFKEKCDMYFEKFTFFYYKAFILSHFIKVTTIYNIKI